MVAIAPPSGPGPDPSFRPARPPPLPLRLQRPPLTDTQRQPPQSADPGPAPGAEACLQRRILPPPLLAVSKAAPCACAEGIAALPFSRMRRSTDWDASERGESSAQSVYRRMRCSALRRPPQSLGGAAALRRSRSGYEASGPPSWWRKRFPPPA